MEQQVKTKFRTSELYIYISGAIIPVIRRIPYENSEAKMAEIDVQ